MTHLLIFSSQLLLSPQYTCFPPQHLLSRIPSMLTSASAHFSLSWDGKLGAGLCFVTNTAKIKSWRSFLKSRRVVLFTDSESVRGSFLKTWSANEDSVLRLAWGFASQRIIHFGTTYRFLMERLCINYHWPTSECLQLFLVQLYPSAFSLAFLSLLRTSRSGVGALL